MRHTTPPQNAMHQFDPGDRNGRVPEAFEAGHEFARDLAPQTAVPSVGITQGADAPAKSAVSAQLDTPSGFLLTKDR